MRRVLLTCAFVLAVVGMYVGVARAQVPPLTVPTSTTSTTEAPTTTTAPTEESTTTTFTEVAPLPESVVTVPEPPPVQPLAAPTAPPTTLVRPRPVVTRTSVATALSGSFAVGVATVLAVAGLFVTLSVRSRPGGFRMNDPRRRWRLLAGVGSLALAAVIGLVGWLKLSLEPEVNRQIPYLASAGMTLVVLAAIGGSLLVAEQLRADDQRIADLEDAVRRLADTLEPIVEAPPRKRS